MASDISEAVRRIVIARARRQCEYCLIHEDNAGFSHEIDHIISRKHGGPSSTENLAYACVLCNRYKGTDIAAITRSGQAVRLFNPRRDSWHDHFKIDRENILPLTSMGEATVRVLRLNAAERIIERILLQKLGLYPSR